MKNKKAQMNLIISIFILALSLWIIIEIWDNFFSKAEESTAESLCMGFNALRMRTKVEEGLISFHTIRNACKTLDKVIPSDIYPQTKEGALEEMRTLTAKCWWMYLEGAEQDMFSDNWPFGTNLCATCYRFKIKKNIGQISVEEFEQSLIDTAYLANMDEDFDDCAPIGGGKCISEDEIEEKRCGDDDYPELKIVVASNKCDENEECCISSKSDECENMGGLCLASGTCKEDGGDYTKQYDKWSCRTGTCCIKEDNYYSYIDYIQNYRGDGLLMYEQNLLFKPEEEQYAITFISPNSDDGWAALIGGGGSVAGGTGIAIILSLIPGVNIVAAIVAGTVVAGTAITTVLLTEDPYYSQINSIFISKLDSVSNECAVQPDTTGT